MLMGVRMLVGVLVRVIMVVGVLMIMRMGVPVVVRMNLIGNAMSRVVIVQEAVRVALVV